MLENCINSSINNNTTSLFEENTIDRVENILGLVSNSFSFFLNLINIIVFSNDAFQKPNLNFVLLQPDLFKYYLFKSTLDFIQSILNFIVYLTFLCSRYVHFKIVIFHIYYFTFGFSTFCSGATEILTTVVLLLSTGNHQMNKLAKQIDFYRALLAMSLFGLITNLYRIELGFYFIDCISAMSDVVALGPQWIRSLAVIASFIRDALFPILLMISNLLLLYQYKVNMRRKNRLVHDVSNIASLATTDAKSKSVRNVTNLALNKITKFKIEITKMTILVGMKSVLCHIPLFLTRFNFTNSISAFYSTEVYYIVSLFLFDVSFSTDFFIYFCFNKKFKAVLYGLFKVSKDSVNQS